MYIYRKGQNQIIETTSAGKCLCQTALAWVSPPVLLGVVAGTWPALWHCPTALSFPAVSRSHPPRAQKGRGNVSGCVCDVPASLPCPSQAAPAAGPALHICTRALCWEQIQQSSRKCPQAQAPARRWHSGVTAASRACQNPGN